MVLLALYFVSMVISLVQAVPMSSFVHSEKCLDDAIKLTTLNRDIFFKDEYDCKPQEMTPERQLIWRTYLWCVGDFKNGTCILDEEYVARTANPTEFSAVADCKKDITSDDTMVCGLQFINCLLPKVGKC